MGGQTSGSSGGFGGYGQSSMPGANFGRTQGYRPGFQTQRPQYGYGGGMMGQRPWANDAYQPTQAPPPQTGGPSPYLTAPGVTPGSGGGTAPGPTTNPANVQQAQQGTRWMSDWGGSGNVFDPAIMQQNGWGFDASGRWNGPVPDEFRNTGSRGDGFTGIRDGGFFVNGRDIVGENYLGGRLDPNNLGAMGGGGTIRDMLGTLGFVGRGGGGGGGLMAPTVPAATRPGMSASTPITNPSTHNPWASSTPNPAIGNNTRTPTGQPTYPGQPSLIPAGSNTRQFGPFGPGTYFR